MANWSVFIEVEVSESARVSAIVECKGVNYQEARSFAISLLNHLSKSKQWEKGAKSFSVKEVGNG